MNEHKLPLQEQQPGWLLLVENLLPGKTKKYSSKSPHALFLYNLSTQEILDMEISKGKPALEQVLDFLHQTLQTVAAPSSSGEKFPGLLPEICVADNELFHLLSGALEELGIPLYHTPNEPAVKYFKKVIPNQLFRQRISGILTGQGVTEELAGAFFQAAARFYRAAPWTYLSLLEPLSIRVLPGTKYFIILQGMMTGVVGLIVFSEWTSLENKLLSKSSDSPLADIPEGFSSCFFSGKNMIPLPDIQATEEHNWELAGERAYPFPVSMVDNQVLRPDRDLLLWLEAALLALADFVPALERDPEGEFVPGQSVLTVQTSAGEQEVEITYPGGKLDYASLPVPRDQNGQLDYRSFLRSEPDLAAQEKALPGAKGDPAQLLIAEAWQETSPASRILLAYQALSHSQQCAAAYLILAEDDADTLGKSLTYYQQAARLAASQLAGQGPLAPDTLMDSPISVIHTYLNAKEGLAHTLDAMGKKADAVRHYQEVLQLVPEDPYYIRGRLLPLLLILGRVREADRLLEDYPDSYNPDWLYTRALRLFQQKGNTRHSRQVLQQALESNPLIADQLINPGLGEEEAPDIIPLAEMKEESHSYRKHFLFLWQRTPGAIRWLEKQTLIEGKQNLKS